MRDTINHIMNRRCLILVAMSVVLMLAALPAMPGLRLEPTRAQGTGAGDRKILGLHAFNIWDKVVPPERAWVKNVKFEVPWSSLEPAPGNFSWSPMDNAINAILADGCESILLLLGGPVPYWARDPEYGAFADRAPPRNLGDWHRFCATVAQRYGPVVDFYEIWNEPGWDRDSEVSKYGVYHFGGQVETEYLPLLQLGYAAIKERDPTASVICGALMYTLRDDPDVGTENYAMLFDEVNRPGQDVAMKVAANRPIVAERFTYSSRKGAGGNDSVAAASRTKWYFEGGSTRTGSEEFLLVSNGADLDATASITYRMKDGSERKHSVTVPASSSGSVYINAFLGEGKDFSCEIEGDRPIVVERPAYFRYGETGSPNHAAMGAETPKTQWDFPEGSNGASIQEYLCLYNPNRDAAEATVTFTMPRGETFTRTVALAPDSRTNLNINQFIGFQGCCDMVSVHPYKSPKFWGPFYANVVSTLRSRGANQEVVTSEVGWPHYSDKSPAAFTEQYQADAIGALGVGGLFDNGCRKIWIFRDVDEEPGMVWDGNYYGLFTYKGSPHPAWSSYIQWQQQLPHYPQLPPALP